MIKENEKGFIERAIELSRQGMQEGNGGPFGCVIVMDAEIIAEGVNMVTSSNDPTAHAEVVAIREACKKLNTFQLNGCQVYTSCEPCPMCLAAIHWARLDRVYYASTRADAALVGFDDAFFYEQIGMAAERRTLPMTQLMAAEALPALEMWKALPNKVAY